MPYSQGPIAKTNKKPGRLDRAEPTMNLFSSLYYLQIPTILSSAKWLNFSPKISQIDICGYLHGGYKQRGVRLL